MIRRSTIFLLTLCILVSIQATGQMMVTGSRGEGSPLRFGVGIGGMNGNKEFDGTTEFQARIFLRHFHTDYIQGELGIGVGAISDWFYETHLVPFDYRLLYSPTAYERWSPYVFLGFGFVGYDVVRSDLEVLPQYAVNDYEEDGLSAYIPLGLGMEFEAEDGLGLDFNLGYNIVFSDDINGSRADDPSDAYWTFLFAVTFNNSGTSRTEYARTSMSARDARRWDRGGMSGPDYDGDGLSDEEENMRYRTDPYNPDTDGDGLRDSYEVQTFHTDPFRADSDLDQLSDGDEVRVSFTDPLKKDTDGDGLDDYEELKVTKSNPLDQDTDHGGVKDGIEVAKKANPLDASDDRMISLVSPYGDNANANANANPYANSNVPATDIARTPDRRATDLNLRFMLDGITFRTGSEEITPGSTRILERAYRVLTENPNLYLEIQGHTDNIGGAAVNLDLSERRSMAVKWWLVNRGVEPTRLNTRGFGYSRPIASNNSEAGRARNRRIEFVVVR